MSLVSSLADFLKPAPKLTPQIRKALDRVASVVDPLLKSAAGFERRLALPVEHALGYCEGLVAALPGPIDINRQSFASDPLIHALFATADDIEQMLGRSQAVRDFLAGPESLEEDYFYALFTARRQQKKQIGSAQHGDVIQIDVPQVVVYFGDQTLIEPSCDLDTTLANLRCQALQSLLLTFHEHVEALRSEREGLRTDTAMERAHLTVLRGKSSGPEFQAHTRHLAHLEADLREKAATLMPDQLIQALADYMSAPDTSLRLTPTNITVDRLGIVSDQAESDDINVNTLSFPEFRGRDKRIHMAMVARVRRDEAQAAVELVSDQRRRFMII
ncbi:MAG: hypothetical protein WCA83_00030 [Azonexus sp.]